MPEAEYPLAIADLLAEESGFTPSDALHYRHFEGLEHPEEYVVPRRDETAHIIGESGTSSSHARDSAFGCGCTRCPSP